MKNGLQDLDTTAEVMSLKEITNLLEVRHNDAMVTVAKMAESPEFGELREIRSSYINNLGAKLPLQTYELDKRQSIAVASKLNTPMLMRVIDKWQELEAAHAPLKLTGVQYAQRQLEYEIQAAKDIALISKHSEKITKKDIETDEDYGYYSIRRFKKLHSGKTNIYKGTPISGKLLIAMSEHMNVPIKKIYDHYDKSINTYHRDVWSTCYAMGKDGKITKKVKSITIFN